MSQKGEKVPNFLDPPPLPQDVLDFFEFGKNQKIDDLIWEKFEIGKILNFGNPPSEKKTYA